MGTIALSIPQTGVPNASEDPKISSDFNTLQTLVNGNIDTNNISASAGITQGQLVPGMVRLAYRNGSANLTAVAGDSIIAVPGITVTLPSPVLNGVVAVTANINVSGASPVTVTGTNINGLGLTAASSFKLGSAVASTILVSDGTGWTMVSGEQDSGWVPLTALHAGLTPGGGADVPAAKLVGNRVYLRGNANNTGGVIAAGSALATIPQAAWWPTESNAQVPIGVQAVAGLATAFVSGSNGVIATVGSGQAIPNSVSFYLGGSYSIS